MIKPIQLLKESFAIYKANFKNIILMAWPIALLSIIGQYYSMNLDKDKAIFLAISLLLVSMLVTILTYLFVSLFFQPALNRTLQKNIDNGNFDSKAGFNFAKKNVWNYILLNFWAIVYLIWNIIKYLAVFIVLLTISILISKTKPNISLILMPLSIAIIVIGVIMNVAKFFVYSAIFFSKGIKPREAVLESIKIGKDNTKKVWMIIIASLMFGILVTIFYAALGFIFRGFPNLVTVIVSAVFASMLIGPISYIIVGKGYSKLASHTHVEAEVASE